MYVLIWKNKNGSLAGCLKDNAGYTASFKTKEEAEKQASESLNMKEVKGYNLVLAHVETELALAPAPLLKTDLR